MSSSGVMKYRPEIDGLRALAVLPVILFHGGIDWMRGGFVGVDVFFVISGYLITGIVLQKLENQLFAITGFFESRLRRIAPALIFVTLCSIPVFYFAQIPSEFEKLAESALFSISYLSNYYFYETLGYFTENAERIPLLHTWSLAVEGQFYLIFPFLLLLFFRFGKPVLIALLIVGVVASLLASEYTQRINPSIGFFYFPTRAWELGAGCLLAVAQSWCLTCPQSRIWQNGLSIAGFLMVAAAMSTFNSTTAHPGLITLIPVVGTMLILFAGIEGTVVGAVLRWRPLVVTGVLSYSIYLWHQPVLALVRTQSHDVTSVAGMAGVLIATFALSGLSYRFVETPFRSRSRINTRAFYCWIVAGMLVTTGVCGVIIVNDGFQDRYIANLPAADRALYGAAVRAKNSDGFDAMQDDGACRFWSASLADAALDRFDNCAGKYGAAKLVLGDSHAMDLFNAFYHAEISPFLVGFARAGCRASEMRLDCDHSRIRDFVATNKEHIDQIFFTEKGSYFLTDYRSLPVLSDAVTATQEYLHSLSSLVPVYWLGPQEEPNITLDLKRLDALAAPRHDDDLAKNLKFLDHYLATAMPNTAMPNTAKQLWYLSKQDLLGYDAASDYRVNGEFTYADGGHWSIFGEKLFGRRLADGLMREGILTPP